MIEGPDRTRRVLLCSFRNGAGKSTLAANLAALAAAAGWRVGLADACFTAPALHLFFGCQAQDPPASLRDLLLGRQALAQTALDVTESLGIAGAGKLFLLPASSRGEDRLAALQDTLDLADLAEGLQGLSRALQLDLLLIDGPTGISETGLSLLALADTALLVLRPNALDFQGTAVLIDVARRLEVPQVQLVLNDVPAAYNMADLKTRAAEALGCPVAAGMPHDEALLECGSAGLIALQPSVRASRPWMDLVQTCLNPQQESSAGRIMPMPRSSRAGRWSLP